VEVDVHHLINANIHHIIAKRLPPKEESITAQPYFNYPDDHFMLCVNSILYHSAGVAQNYS
jgi:hypothetical protein